MLYKYNTICKRVHINVHTQAPVQAHDCKHIPMSTHTHAHMLTLTHTHAHTHTHTHINLLAQ